MTHTTQLCCVHLMVDSHTIDVQMMMLIMMGSDEIEASRITGENYDWLDETLNIDFLIMASPDAELDEDSDDDQLMWPDDGRTCQTDYR